MTRPILHVISGLRTGGAETMLVALCAELLARGIPQHVVSLTSGGPNAARLAALGVDLHAFEPRGTPGAALSVLRLARLVRRLRPAVLQGWLYHGDLFAALAHRLAGAPRGVVLAWGLRNSDIDEARYGRLLSLSAHLSRWPALIVSNSRVGADFHAGRGYRPRRLAVIPNGIDTALYRPDADARAAVRTELGLAPRRVVAVHTARVDPMKDHACLLRAAAATPGIDYVLVGAGTEALSLPANARTLGRRDDVARLTAAGDIAVSSSAFGEGFSNALAEGMAAGLVPVATRVGDAATILGGHGRLVPPGDSAALAEALVAIAALDPEDRRARGAAARDHVAAAFSPRAMASRYLDAWRAAGAELPPSEPR